MKTAYNNIQWVIQRNLTNTGDLQELKQGYDKIGVAYNVINRIRDFQPLEIPYNDMLTIDW
jgi:hypothetical protein